MSLAVVAGGSSISSKVVVGQKGLSASASGPDGSFGNILVDDIAGTTTIRGWQYTTVEESACSQPRLFSGWIGPRKTTRSPDSGTAARLIDVTMVDLNAIFSIRLITGSDGKRPSETQLERIAWLLASDYLDGMVNDYGLVAGPAQTFEEADFRGMYPMDVLQDLAGPIFKTFFAYWDATNSGVGLFFDDPITTTSTCTLSITNVAGAANGTTSFYPQNTELDEDPSEVYAKVRYKHRNGTVIRNDNTTHTTFFSGQSPTGGDLGYRGLNVDNDRIGLTTTATNMADGLLDRHDTEQPNITCTITVPDTEVGLIDAGMRILSTFTHLGITAQYYRITRRTIRQSADANSGYYDVDLELNNNGIGLGAGGSGGFPHPATETLSIVQSSIGLSDRTMADAITEGSLLVYLESARTTLFAHTGYTQSALGTTTDAVGGKTGVYWKVAGAGESQTLAGFNTDQAIGWYELSGYATEGASAALTGTSYAVSTGSVAVVAGGIAFGISGLGSGGGFDAGAGYSGAYTPGSGWTEDFDSKVASGHPATFMAHRTEAAATTVAGSASFLNDGAGPWPWGMQVVAFSPTTSDNPPEPGRWVYGETPTPAPGGGRVTFSTAFPFADGSLSVYVDHVNETAAITSYDGAAQTFTLAFDPRSWETLLVDYQGR